MRSAQVTELRNQFRRREHIARKGEAQQHLLRIEEGWACRYCDLSDGRRQIVALFLPGDYCEPQWLLSGKADLPIAALTPVTAQSLPLAEIHTRPDDLVMCLLRSVLEAHTRQTAWIVNLGRKSATERVEELLVELFERLQAAGLVSDNRCALPLTQQDIADIVGLTPVHVNRVLADLRNRGRANFSGRTLHLPDPEALGVARPREQVEPRPVVVRNRAMAATT